MKRGLFLLVSFAIMVSLVMTVLLPVVKVAADNTGAVGQSAPGSNPTSGANGATGPTGPIGGGGGNTIPSCPGGEKYDISVHKCINVGVGGPQGVAGSTTYCQNNPGPFSQSDCTTIYIAGAQASSNNAQSYCKSHYPKNQSSCESIYKSGYNSPGSVSQTSGGATTPSGGPTLSCNLGISFSSFPHIIDTVLSIFNPLNWLVCGAVTFVDGLVSFFNSYIMQYLPIGTSGNTKSANPSGDNPSSIFSYDGNNCTQTFTINVGGHTKTKSACNAYYSAWSYFRDLALGLLVIISLIVILVQAMGMEILDAYTIRKMLPRILVGAIILTLAWPLMDFLVILSNDLGYGIQYLLQAPFSGITDTINTSNPLVDIVGAAAGIALGLFGLLTIAGTAALAVLVAFITLLVRQIVIVLLIIFSPIAIVAYILPVQSSQRVYKFWWDNFIKLLLMFPIIVSFITIGHIFSALASQNSGAAIDHAIDQLMAVFFYFGPYFALPLTFRLSGSIMSGVGNFVNSQAAPARGALSQLRSNIAKNRLRRAGEGKLLREDTQYGLYNAYAKRFNKASAGIYNLRNAGTNPLRTRSRMASARSQEIMLAAQRTLSEDPEVQSALLDDNIAEALQTGVESYVGSGHYGGHDDATVRQFLKDRGLKDAQLEESVALARSVRHKVSPHALEATAWLANMGTGTGFAEKEVTDEFGNVHRTHGGDAAIASLANFAGDDYNLMVRELAAGRERANNANRVDIAGMSFGEQVKMTSEYIKGNLKRDEVAEQMRKGAKFGQSRGSLIGRRPQVIKAMVPQFIKDFDELMRSGNEREFMQELAMAAAGQQVAGQVSMENASEHAKYMNHKINIPQTEMHVLASINASEGKLRALQSKPRPTSDAERQAFEKEAQAIQDEIQKENISIKGSLASIKDDKVKDAVINAARTRVRVTGQPLTEVTVQDMLDSNRSNRELTAMVYQYGNEFAQQASMAAREAAQAGQGNPPNPMAPPV
jgi:hypothetical protein